MRAKLFGFGVILVLVTAGCTPQLAAPPHSTLTSEPTPIRSASTPATDAGRIVIGADFLSMTDQSGKQRHFRYDKWNDDVVSIMTYRFGADPRIGSFTTQTNYFWDSGLLVIHNVAPADYLGEDPLFVQAVNNPTNGTSIATRGGVRFGDSVASVARYAVYCNIDKKCFENVSTTSGSSTTLRVLDSTGPEADARLVIGYVDAEHGVVDIITADRSWGTTNGIDVRD